MYKPKSRSKKTGSTKKKVQPHLTTNRVRHWESSPVNGTDFVKAIESAAINANTKNTPDTWINLFDVNITYYDI